MNKTKHPSYPTISLIKIQKQTVFDRFTVTAHVLVLQCLLCTHAFKMTSCVIFIALLIQSCFSRFLLRIYINTWNDFLHDGMTFSPDLELKNIFCLALICSLNG